MISEKVDAFGHGNSAARKALADGYGMGIAAERAFMPLPRCVYSSLPPANETIVTGGAETIGRRQVALWRTRAQNPKDAIEHATVIYPPNAARLVGQHRLDRGPFIIAEFVAQVASSE